MKKIYEMRNLILEEQSASPTTKGNLNEIFKAIRDGHKSNDVNYMRICFSVILDHIVHLDEKCGLSENDGRLKLALKVLQSDFEVYPGTS